MGLGRWMQRRQAAKDLKKLVSMSPLDRTRICGLCHASWRALILACKFPDINPVDSLWITADSPLKVSGVRIQAALENAPDGQLMALSIWQTTARATGGNVDPELVAIAVAIWNLLCNAGDVDEPNFAYSSREFAQDCFNALGSQSR